MAAPDVTARWTSAAHDHLWTDAANWSPGAPAAGVVARFGRGGSDVDLAAAAGMVLEVGQIEVWGGSVKFADGTMHWLKPPYEKGFSTTVGLRIDGGGNLVVAQTAALLGLHTMLLGDVSAATLDVQGTIFDSQVYVGHVGPVSITVDGPAARWNTAGPDQSFELGGAAPVSMIISDGGHVADATAWTDGTADSTATVGGISAGASLLVTDPGSELRFALLDVGGSYNGTLEIAHGGLVLDRGATVGELGDGYVSVDGPGSAWNSLDGLSIDGAAPRGTVSVTNGGTVRFGAYGLQLEGALDIDAISRLIGAVLVMSGGNFSALPTSGSATSTVTLDEAIALAENPTLGSTVGNFFGSAPGVTLAVAGQVTVQSSAYDPFSVGAGHVILGNADNGDFATSLFGGVLEVAQAGASGDGTISFLDTAGATLEIDQTGTLANSLTGFGSSVEDVIDLAGIDFSKAPSLSWQPSGGHDPLLVISDDFHEVTLQLGAGYRLADFVTASDGHEGTALTYHR